MVRVLLVGELSGLHRHLAQGLRKLGHEATTAARSDGFKNIQADYSFDFGFEGTLGGMLSRVRELQLALSNSRHDVVQLVNSFSLSGRFAPTPFLVEKLEEKGVSLFLLAAGSDAFFWRHGRPVLKSGLFDDHLKFDLKKDASALESDSAYRFNKHVADLATGVIPVMYEYEVSYASQPNRLNTIPLPVNTEAIPYRENQVGRKLVIFHGLNRYGFKGTRLVEEAFSVLADRYPNDLELVIDGKMPVGEYLNLMSRTNVVIDQMYSHSLGMNGVQALAMGKVVLGGVEPESLRSLGLQHSPAIGLSPTVQSIVQNVEALLESRDSIPQRGFESREFAEQVHGHIKVASQYVSTWERAR